MRPTCGRCRFSSLAPVPGLTLVTLGNGKGRSPVPRVEGPRRPFGARKRAPAYGTEAGVAAVPALVAIPARAGSPRAICDRPRRCRYVFASRNDALLNIALNKLLNCVGSVALNMFS